MILQDTASLEVERDHALDRKTGGAEDDVWTPEDDLLARANAAEQALDSGSFEALESDAEFDHVLFDSQQFGLGALSGSDEEQDYLGLPGLLESDQVAHVLQDRQRQQQRGGGGQEAAERVSAHRALAEQRKELNKLVSAYARKAGQPHAIVHAELRRNCGGPELATATGGQVAERVETIRRWPVGRG